MTASKSWRDTLPIHPAADLFPLLPPDELRILGADIVKNGLTSPIALWRADPKGQAQLLDGRNRLDAIESATGKLVEVGAPSLMAGEFLATNTVVVLDKATDPVAYVISANVRRRHLTADRKREIVAALLKANPERSNNATAKIVNVDDKTVGAVRAELEGRSEIPNVSTRTDSKGRKQPATRRRSKRKPAAAKRAVPPDRNDIGRDSTSEVALLRVRNEQLQADKRRLEIENSGLRSEVEELKGENRRLKIENFGLHLKGTKSTAGTPIPESAPESVS